MDGGTSTAPINKEVSGGNGGAGELLSKLVSVSPGSTISLSVGTGGTGGKDNYEGGSFDEGYSSGYEWTGQTGAAGGSSYFGDVMARGGKGGYGGYGYYEYAPDEDEEWNYATNGANGTSYGNGGAGGAGAVYLDKYNAYKRTAAANGSNGWVIIEFGGDI